MLPTDSAAPTADATTTDLATALNRGCYCHTLDMAQLRSHLLAPFSDDPQTRAMMEALPHTHPHLFSSTVVFVSQATRVQLERVVACLDHTMGSAAWAQSVLADAPQIARADHGPRGVFMGYDFHLTEAGPQLIEINTNAGGALLNASLHEAQTHCCESLIGPGALEYTPLTSTEHAFVQMFRAEWALQRPAQTLHTIAIVDDAPEQQYLAPEFALFQRLLQRHGLQALVVDGRALEWNGTQLLHQGVSIDMVYNRLTDFDLSEPAHLPLRQAYETGAVVLTPNPHVHALRADKQHLIRLSQESSLEAAQVAEAERRLLLASVPPTVAVTPERAEQLWSTRAQWFFKPRDGFGARAVYRGDKITRKVWEQVLKGNYIAQASVAPPLRALDVGAERVALKYDLRAYSYAGKIQLLAARIYQGQTTNFRTEGGGFAPVVVVPDRAASALQAALECQRLRR